PSRSTLFPYTTLFRSWVRPVIEGDSKFFLGCSDLVDVVGERIGIVLLAGNEVGGGVVSKSAVTAFRSIEEVPHVPIAFQDEVRADRKSTRLNSSHLVI